MNSHAIILRCSFNHKMSSLFLNLCLMKQINTNIPSFNKRNFLIGNLSIAFEFDRIRKYPYSSHSFFFQVVRDFDTFAVRYCFPLPSDLSIIKFIEVSTCVDNLFWRIQIQLFNALFFLWKTIFVFV